MLTLPPGMRVFVATERVDGRKGIDGLSVLVRSQFAEDLLSGTMFVFFSRRADRVRADRQSVRLKLSSIVPIKVVRVCRTSQ